MALLALVLALSSLFALGPQAVHCFNTISFSSVTQCGSFDVRFSGGKLPASLPLTLTVVPFNSTPIFITIPSFSWNASTATGAAVTFLPLAAGTEFVASLDDAFGQPTGLVSDVIAVEPSTNFSCIPDPSTLPPPRYTLPDVHEYFQCAPFDVSYTPGIVDVPPTIRAFSPKNNSFPVNLTSVPIAGTALYEMGVPQGRRTVLMLSDDSGFHQTSDLFVVGGDSTSDTSCLPVFDVTPSSDTSNPSKTASGGLSRPAVIAIAVVITVVVTVIAVAMVFWSCLHRRRIRDAAQKLNFVVPPADPKVWADSIKNADAEQYPRPMTVISPRGEKQLEQFVFPKEEHPLPPVPTFQGDQSSYATTSYVVRHSASVRSSSSSSSLGTLSLLRSGKLSVPQPPPMLPSLHTSPFVPPLRLPASRTASRTASQAAPSSRTRSVRSARSRNHTSVSSEDIEYMLEVGTIASGVAGTSIRSLGTVATQAAASSETRSTTDTRSVSRPSRTTSRAATEREIDPPLPMLPSPASFSNPSMVRSSDGQDVTNIYDMTNWVARSLPSSPDSAVSQSISRSSGRRSQLPTILTPGSYRDPPQALIPSSPMSRISSAPEEAYTVVAGTQQP